MTNPLQHGASFSWRYLRAASTALALAVVLGPVLLATQPAQAQSYTVLYSFTGTGGDGANSDAGLVRDAAGNLYGTTYRGGAFGYGTVFKLDTTGTETVVQSFNYSDGAYPQGGLVLDAEGNLYGTASHGGASGLGTVFKVNSTMGKVLYSFTRYPDGQRPVGGLVRDVVGNLYGTTFYGGTSGGGTVFKLDATDTETVLHSFAGGATDGEYPVAGLLRDTAGNLYGTTTAGGAFACGSSSGCGTVFKVDTTGTETVLYSFAGGRTDGEYPAAGLVRTAAGTLYGTTYLGGHSNGGTVFKLDTTGTETVLRNFNYASGEDPTAGLVRDAAGNFYGTTYNGGAFNLGSVFKLDKTGKRTVLHSFAGGAADGANSCAGLVGDGAGNFYGTTYYGGVSNLGTVFKLTP